MCVCGGGCLALTPVSSPQTQRELLQTGLWTTLYLMSHYCSTQDKEGQPGEIRRLRLKRGKLGRRFRGNN